MDKPKASTLSVEIAKTIPGRGRQRIVSSQFGHTVRSMLDVARQWEAGNTWREHDGHEPLPPPFSVTVMSMLERVNESRVKAERRMAAEQSRRHSEAAAQHAKLELLKPNVSRRVLNERRERTKQRIEDRRARSGEVSRDESELPGREGGHATGVQS